MIVLVLSWAALVAVACIVGHAVLASMKDALLLRRGDRVVLAVWIGLVASAWILLGLSLFAPLTPTTGALAAMSLLLVASGVSRARRQLLDVILALGWWRFAGLTVLAAAVAFSVATQTVTHTDTGLYHYQSVRWFAEFGAVHGLALLHDRLGFVSAWFALVAPFDWMRLQGHIGVLPGGLVLFLMAVHLTLVGQRLLTGRAKSADWFAGVALSVAAASSLLFRFPQSLSPDMALLMFPILVCWLMLVISEPSRAGISSNGVDTASWRNAVDVRLGTIILAGGATLIKLNAVPIGIVAGLYYWLTGTGRRLRRFLVGLCVGALLLAPLVAVTFEQTGCIAYPNASLCLPVAWGPETEKVSQLTDTIARWGQWRGEAPDGSAGQWSWVGPWLTDGKNAVPLFLVGISLLILLVVDPRLRHGAIRWPLAVSLAGLGFVLVTTWNTRFAIGYVASFPGLAVVALLSRWPMTEIVSRLPRPSFTRSFEFPLIAVVVALVLAVGATLFAGTRRDPLDVLVIPPLLPVSTQRESSQNDPAGEGLALIRKNAGDFSYYVPSTGAQCWDAPLPCTGTRTPLHVHLRNPELGLAGGFERN